MSSTFTCPRGHQWETGTPQCPVCGESVARSLETTGADHSPAPAASACLPPLSVPGYEILIELGRGGMGVVHQARHRDTGRLVALKVLRDALLDSPQQRSRFRTEAEALTRLRHPNVVSLIEAGEQDGRPYFVMELVTGGSLDRRLAGQPQPVGEAAAMTETLARAVAFAHQHGIVHRDLKPGNILLGEDGTPKLNDFGLARQLDADTRQTASGAVLGTPRYMSPEQAEGRSDRIGPATDVWALGVILYEMLVGRPPFAGSGLIETLEQVRNLEPEPPSKAQPGVSRDLETICLKCLHKDPARRYATAEALADDLRRFQEDRPIKARRVGLRERAVKWRRRHPVTAALAASAVLLLLSNAALGLWYWDAYHRVKVTYHATYTSRYGVKEGVGCLTEQEARQRDVSYKVYRRAGRVVRLDVVNGHGELTVAPEVAAPLERESDLEPLDIKQQGKPSRFEYSRNQRGELLEETAYDRNGNVVWALHYTAPTIAHFKTVPGTVGTWAGTGLVEGLPQSRTRAGAAYLEFTWTSEGFEAEVRFLDRNGKATPDDGHTFGKRQEHDSRGLLVRQTWLDARGQPTRHSRTRVGVLAFAYDERGNRIEEAYYAPDGRPCLDRDGFHKGVGRYDERGNVVQEACFDVAGRPCLSRSGYHQRTRRYDERGNAIEQACFGVDERPCLTRVGFHRGTARYDERGNLIEEAYFDAADRPCLRKDGWHKRTRRYDERGNLIEEACFGTDGRPCLCKDGWHRGCGRHNERGKLIEETYFDTAARPCLHRDRFHRRSRRYDERGNRVEEACFGTDGQPCLSSNGWHRGTAEYDERGNLIQDAYFGVDRRPCLRKEGYHKGIGRYDERGNRVEQTSFGVDDRPCQCKGGFHKITDRFDERGNPIEQACFAVDGRPCAGRAGFHKALGRYDERGNLIEESYFDADGRPCRHSDGYHKRTRRYDDRDNVIEENCFGTDERPCRCKPGYHKGTGRYDERGQRIEEKYFGVDGQPCLHTDGYHRATIRYDERGNPVELTCFGMDGLPCLARIGAHRVTTRYDQRDQVIETTLSDVTNRKWAQRFFDELGKVLRTTVFLYQNEQTIVHFGRAVAWLTRTIDDRNRVVEEAYHGSDGRLVRNRRGYARSTIAYAARGAAARTYFDVDGKPVATRVVVLEVTPATQAQRLKIRPGDVLVSYDGRPLKEVNDLPVWPPGAPRTGGPRKLVILRKGNTITVEVAPGPLGVLLAEVAVPTTK
jgi:YD repeat-containing protein